MTDANPLASEQITQEDRDRAKAVRSRHLLHMAISGEMDTFADWAEEASIRAMIEFAALSATSAPSDQDASSAIRGEASFLCDRLREFERDLLDDEAGNQYHGHVTPSLERLEALLDAPSDQAASQAQGEEYVEGILLPPGTVDDQQYMDGWLDGQTYLLMNQRAAAPGATAQEEGTVDTDRLFNAAENLVIAIGMAWDLDGVIEEMRAALPPVRDAAPDGVERVLRDALGIAKRAILEAAQDTLWSDDCPVETVVDRIDAALAEADGQQVLSLTSPAPGATAQDGVEDCDRCAGRGVGGDGRECQHCGGRGDLSTPTIPAGMVAARKAWQRVQQAHRVGDPHGFEHHAAALTEALAAAPKQAEQQEVEALVQELRPLVDAAAGPNGWDWMFPLRVQPVDGKPTIVSHKGGNLFRGYIGTWQEADLLVALANAAPRILAALNAPTGAVEKGEGM